VTAWLAAQTSLANQPWRSTNAAILVPAMPRLPGQPATVTLQVADTNLSGARIVWEARDQEPSFGSVNHTFTTSLQEGLHWIEAEVQWPDGRRAFATNVFTVSADAPPELRDARSSSDEGFSFVLAGKPFATYFIQASTNLTIWEIIMTNALPSSGMQLIADPAAGAFPHRYYRALKAQ
jgi:hypothetical protein